MAVPPSAALLRLALRVLKEQRGETVTYTVAGYSIELVGVLTRPTAQQTDMAEDAVIESRAWDWLIDPAELLDADGEQIEPARGHKITRADGTVYLIQPSDVSDLCWRWSDGQRTWRRIHSEENQ